MASLNSLKWENWDEFAKHIPVTEGQDLVCDITTILFLIKKLQTQSNNKLQIGFTSPRSGHATVLSNALQLTSSETLTEIIDFGTGAESTIQIGSITWTSLPKHNLSENISQNTSLMVLFDNIEPAVLQHVLNCGIPCALVFGGTSIQESTNQHLSMLKNCYANITLEPQHNPFSWNHLNSHYLVFQGRLPSCKRAIVVGDVHGCLDELQLLLSKCEFNPEHDELIMVGDLCGKGPKSKELLKFLRDTNAKAVLGNHDVHTMTCHTKKLNGVNVEIEDPTHAYCVENFGEEDWKWLESLPYYLVLDRFSTIVVHAGLLPDVPLNKQDPINMTYMRNIVDGKASKEATHGVPWASLWKGPYHVLFGHDAVRGFQKHPYATGLDTGCCYGGALTACILPQRKLVSVPALKMYSAPTKPIKKTVIEEIK